MQLVKEDRACRGFCFTQGNRVPPFREGDISVENCRGCGNLGRKHYAQRDWHVQRH